MRRAGGSVETATSEVGDEGGQAEVEGQRQRQGVVGEAGVHQLRQRLLRHPRLVPKRHHAAPRRRTATRLLRLPQLDPAPAAPPAP